MVVPYQELQETHIAKQKAAIDGLTSGMGP
jgi:hypothetical protein